MTLLNKIILGSAQFGLNYGISNTRGKTIEEEVFRILDKYSDSGFVFIDTAEGYGDAQRILGNYNKKKQNAFKYLSKFKAGSKPLAECLTETLEGLGVGQLECYSYHSFKDYEAQKYRNDLILARESKLINNIGLSVYTAEEFSAGIDDDLISIIQIPYNLLDNASIKEHLLIKAKSKGKTIHARSIFLQGLFFIPVDQLPQKLSPLKPELEKLKKLAESYDVELPVLALQYVLYNPYIDNVVLGVESCEQLEQTLSYGLKELHRQVFEEVSKIKTKYIELLNPGNW